MLEKQRGPFVSGFQPYNRIIRNLGATGIGRMIRMRSAALPSKEMKRPFTQQYLRENGHSLMQTVQ
ncbi:hypothetical protein C172_09164 [Paenibacillus sp. FSL H8-457]|nr:hypothetical protein C172_09164 [Paenibacillus sp. FSL H8-457]